MGSFAGLARGRERRHRGSQAAGRCWRARMLDRLAVALPVASSRRGGRGVLPGGGAGVRAGASGEVSLGLAALGLAQRPGAVHPQVAAALSGGLDEQRGVAAQELDADLDTKVVEEDNGPGAASRRPDVDLRRRGRCRLWPRREGASPAGRRAARASGCWAADGQVARSRFARLAHQSSIRSVCWRERTCRVSLPWGACGSLSCGQLQRAGRPHALPRGQRPPEGPRPREPCPGRRAARPEAARPAPRSGRIGRV